MHKVFVAIALFVPSCANHLTKAVFMPAYSKKNCHFFWYAFRNIADALSLLAQFTTHYVTCRNMFHDFT